MLLEEFKSCVPDNVKAHLKEQQVKEVHQAAVMADDYVLTHKTDFTKGNNFPGKRRFKTNNSPLDKNKSADNNSQLTPDSNPDGSDTSESKANNSNRPSVVCDYCGKTGHPKPKCYAFLRKKASDSSNTKPVAFTTSVPPSAGQQLDEVLVRGCKSEVREDFLPVVTEGCISVEVGDSSPKYPVTILRDTGASQSLLLKGAVPLSLKSSLGATMLITGVGNDVFEVPLHHVFLKSDLVSGPMTVGVAPSLPQGLDGITLILGNDVAGTRVVVDPYMTDRPSTVDNTEKLEKEFPGIFPSCVTTRAMSRKAHECHGCSDTEFTGDVELADTFMTRLASENLSETVTDSEVKASISKVDGPSPVVH